MAANWVADYSLARPGAHALKAAGAVGVIRYIFPGRNDGACITPVEIADFNANGLPYGLVMEAEATWILRGYQQGFDLARAAVQIEASLGIPPGVTYAASDFDVQPSQFAQALATLHGMADGYGSWARVGVYGSKGFCEWVGANSLITKFWSTDAWSNYTPAHNAALHQHAQWPNDVPYVDGCDHNLILGDWAPRTPMEDDLTPQQDLLLKTIGGAVMQLAGQVSALAQNVIHGDATHYSLDHLAKDMGTLLAKAGVSDPAVLKALGDLKTAVEGMPAGPGGTVDLAPVLDKLNNLKLGTLA